MSRTPPLSPLLTDRTRRVKKTLLVHFHVSLRCCNLQSTGQLLYRSIEPLFTCMSAENQENLEVTEVSEQQQQMSFAAWSVQAA